MRWYAASRVGVLLAVGVCLLAGAAPQALALPAVQNVRGEYNGFYQSAVNMDDRAPMHVVITEQRQRRFTGKASVPAGEFAFEGTVAADGGFSIVGGNGVARLLAQGTTRFLGDGSVFVQMHYRFWPAGGFPGSPGSDRGLIGLLRDTGFAGAPDVTGAWDGTYRSTMDPADTGPLAVRVSYQKGSRFDGAMMVNGLVFPFVGTIGAPPTGIPPDPCDILGFGPAGWFIVSGELLPAVRDPAAGETPAEFDAQYQIFFTDGTRDAGMFVLFQ